MAASTSSANCLPRSTRKWSRSSRRSVATTGSNIRTSETSFSANFDCVILDCAPVTIGREVKLGPRVQILTATHPTDPVIRAAGRELEHLSRSATASGLAPARSSGQA